jgi:hypothetical protein
LFFAILTAAVAVLFAFGASGAYGATPKATPNPSPALFQASYTVQSAPGGTISGKILYQGKPIKPKKITVTQNNSECGNTKEIYPVRVENGGVADAVVWIDGIDHGKAFDLPPAVLDQKGCMFIPPVMLMKPGDLKVVNSDPVTHNVHIYAKNNRGFNQVMPPGSDPLEVPLLRSDTAVVRCDVHTWMQGHIVVAANPYYVLSGSGGSFTLTDVPPGTYHLKVWQAELGTKDQTVTVQAGQTATADFTLGN